ncbi:MAG TPA: glycosyltransferase family 4 protein [Candidatus Krumholzibacteria bacterium]|nr:glycosyltransferase family 4 protein [Candidatus Krumholzibacteria bacterium]
MKVLVFMSELQVGGAESMSIGLANALAAEGIDVHFASASGPLRANLDQRVTFHRIDNPNVLPVRVAHTMSLLLREIKPDVIHSQGASCAVVASIARRASKVFPKRVLTHHSGKYRRAPRWLAGELIARASDHFIAISRAKYDDMVSSGIPREQVSLIPNFVDVENLAARARAVDTARARRELQIPADAKVLVMAGRLVHTKRFDLFIKIAAETARRYRAHSVHALVVGDGPQLENIRKLARDESAPATIHLLGYQRDVVPSLAMSDVVVFPSQHPEVLPMFLIEASAAGRPIVCSDIAANREIVVDGVTGRVLHGDVADYAQAVVELLEDEALAARFGAAGHTTALERFDQKHVAQETIAVYRRLLAGREPKG